MVLRTGVEQEVADCAIRAIEAEYGYSAQETIPGLVLAIKRLADSLHLRHRAVDEAIDLLTEEREDD